MRTSERGFGWLLLLFALAAGGAALAAAGRQWTVTLQREREAELLFRGQAIRSAIEQYGAREVGGRVEYPSRLEDLLQDARGGAVQHHLRRLYLDPFTGRADWLLLRDAQDRIVGVASRSRVTALARHALPVQLATRGDADEPPRVGDWHFVAAHAFVRETP